MKTITRNPKLILSGLALALVGSLAAIIIATIFAVPGDALYPLARQFDKIWASRAVNPAARTKSHLDLANQQMRDLEIAAKTAPQLIAPILAEWERATFEAIFNLAEVNLPDQELLLELLSQTTRQNVETMTRLQPSISQMGPAGLLAEKITAGNNIYRYATARPFDMLALLTLTASPAATVAPAPVAASAAAPPEKIEPVSVNLQVAEELLTAGLPVPFPPASTFEHPFPLDGRHGQIACEACHTMGIYAGLPDRCTDCHTSPHQELFTAEMCLNCHQTASWSPLLPADHPFLLVGAHLTVSCRGCHPADNFQEAPTTCQACHAQDEPHQGKFGAECQVCHTPQAWVDADFDHVSLPVADCQSCHTRPAGHYSGQCSSCHFSAENWTQIQFDHTGLTECQDCHSDNTPPDHYPGQCSNCHLSTQDWGQFSFNHASQTDCQTCHKTDAPPNHFAGQCSNCHPDTERWGQVQFNHTGFTDCQACHGRDKPINHYPGQCSECHASTQTWRQVSFTHAGRTNCQSCHNDDRPPEHYPGQCGECHTSTQTWTQIEFDHTGHTECGNCHIGAQYPRHYKGLCYQCHQNSTNWMIYSFDHIGQTNCEFCHARPPNHQPGQCGMCHKSHRSFSMSAG